MFLILNEEKRIIMFANKANPILGGVQVGTNQFISGRCLSVANVQHIPSYVRPGYYFYKNGEFIADPNRVDAASFFEMSNKVNELDIQLNDKPIAEMTLDEYKTYRRNENNTLLAKCLKTHPLLWKNGKYYGITKDDQTELADNLTAYNLKTSVGIQSEVKWHAVNEECEVWDPNELAVLAITIQSMVVPLVELCQKYKVAIVGCKTKEEVSKINLDYSDATITPLITNLG